MKGRRVPSPSQVSRWQHPSSSSSERAASVQTQNNSETEPWLTARGHKDSWVSLCYPSMHLHVLSAVHRNHTLYLTPGFSAPASAEVIFKPYALRKGTGVEIKFTGSQHFYRPRQHKGSGAAETQSHAPALVLTKGYLGALHKKAWLLKVGGK